MRRRTWWTFWLIALLTVVAGMFAWPTDVWFVKGVRLHPGLDLQGGTQLVYELDLATVEPNEQDDAIAGVQEAIRRRVDALGVAEPVIQTSRVGEREAILVELPGVQDVGEAKSLIGRTARLEFWQPALEGDEGIRATFVGSFAPTDLTGADLTRASVSFDQSGATGSLGLGSSPVVQLDFNADGREKFRALTESHLGQPIAVFLDEELITAPTVQSEITDGTAIISGGFSIDEAKELAIQLNAGALPVPVELVEERTIGATLGALSVQESLLAGVVGLLLVALYMILYYRLPGFLATMALMIYGIITLALFEIIPVTLTLAGIAGFILSIGMAVDANILIFERMREEIRGGKGSAEAVEDGFRRAWSSILDSNVSSLITAAILYYTTTGLVRGFAVTLAIGILVSMFTAVTVSRTLLRLNLNGVARYAKQLQ
ncbi:protein translocase subunit SecD [Candidatus Berkelbacteria bacterium]|nr:protein translocase subunit SecD [Candidatus Berkelbacteria bacterium]